MGMEVCRVVLIYSVRYDRASLLLPVRAQTRVAELLKAEAPKASVGPLAHIKGKFIK